jgi:cytoskeletal protein CcmA (bactofilin family)
MIKIKGAGSEELNGFMDEGTEFIGELRFRDTFRIDGRLKGKVVSEHTLIVGETGQVDAEIECAVVSIKGAVSGRVAARDRIELLSGARVQATLISPRLIIEEGAVFQGQCDMGSAAAAAAAKGSVVPMAPGLRSLSDGRS